MGLVSTNADGSVTKTAGFNAAEPAMGLVFITSLWTISTRLKFQCC